MMSLPTDRARGRSSAHSKLGVQLTVNCRGDVVKRRGTDFRLISLVPADPLGGAVNEHNHQVRERLRQRLSETDPQAFEHLIADLLTSLGFEGVEVTKYSGGGGIDVRAVGGVTDVRTAVQVKRWANNVAGKTVRELRGGLGPHERGLIITLSDFTRDARTEATATDRTPITLIGGDQLLDLLIDNGIGVAARAVAILQLDEEALVEGTEDEPQRTAFRHRRRDV